MLETSDTELSELYHVCASNGVRTQNQLQHELSALLYAQLTESMRGVCCNPVHRQGSGTWGEVGAFVKGMQGEKEEPGLSPGWAQSPDSFSRN